MIFDMGKNNKQYEVKFEVILEDPQIMRFREELNKLEERLQEALLYRRKNQ